MKGRILIAGLFLALALGCSGCGTDPAPEEELPPVNTCQHEYTDWIQGEDTHYQVCPLCGETHDEEAHRYVNIYGLSYELRESNTATVRINYSSKEDMPTITRVSVFVRASEATLRLAHAPELSGNFASYDELKLTGKTGWFEIPLKKELSGIYSFFRLSAIGGQITVREIVFFGKMPGSTEEVMLSASATDVGYRGLVDCQQLPGTRFACEVCGKERP